MKKFILAFLFCSCVMNLSGQTIRLYREASDTSHIIYGDNDEYYPASVKIDFTLKNMAFSENEDKYFVLPPKSKRFKIGELKRIIANAGAGISFKYQYTMGDVTRAYPEHSFLYDLPFAKSKSYRIYQGYNGTLSHQNENSLDFTMPEGTEILAARDGVVVKVVESNTITCTTTKDCQKYNNEMTILHEDGTFASYVHLRYNGANYNEGDSIKRGDVIAYSGNTGYSTGPHLHFTCFKPEFGGRKTLQTRFRINNGGESAYLKEGSTYTRGY